MHRVIEDTLAEAWEVLGIHKLIGALNREHYDVDTVQAYWLVHGSLRYELAPAGTGAQIEVLLVPRDNHDNRASQDTCPRTKRRGKRKITVGTLTWKTCVICETRCSTCGTCEAKAGQAGLLGGSRF